MANRLLIAQQELAQTPLAPYVSRPLKPSLDSLLKAVRDVYTNAANPNRLDEQELLEQTIEAALLSEGHRRVLDGCAAIFSRLGYFPSIASMQRQFPSWSPQLPLRMLAEAAGRIAALAPHGDLEKPYTPFQADLHNAFLHEDAASISAPTSSGKSFVLGRLIYDFASVQRKNVAYIVPTRALIAEVSGRIRAYLRSRGARNPIRTSPVPLPGSQLPSGHVYVLTQERLLGLLGGEPGKIHLDVLLVDEAHEVQAGARGILLETAVEFARRRFPALKVLMASPGIPNPEYLLRITTLAPLAGVGHIDWRSPVVHNYFELRAQGGKTQVLLHQGEAAHALGELDEAPPPESPLAAWAAVKIHQPGHTTLVYCRSPNEAETTADWLADRLSFKAEVDPEVEALAEFIQKDVHPGHPLSDMLRKGLATHYGKLPPTVKARIETLAVAGKIDILCCTSTLLSGVNLPCRNMVMHDPRKGQGNPGQPLTEAEIRNLAGRAGRIDSDLVGNVWVVGTLGTPARIPRETLPPIETAFSSAIREGARAIVDLADPEVKERARNEMASAFTARAYDLAQRGISLASLAGNSENLSAIREADAAISVMTKVVKVPPALIAAHHSIAPSIIQKLLDSMLALDPPDLKKWVPLPHRISPADYDELNASDAQKAVKYENPKLHFAKVMPYLAEAFKDGRYMWPDELEEARAKQKKEKKKGWPDASAWRLATISAHWINGVPLGLMLRNAVSLRASKEKIEGPVPPKLIRDVVRETMTTIEDDVRFALAQRWRLIQDLLTYIYTDIRPDPSALDGMVDLNLKLEFGTIHDEALAIMGLGFSRAATAEIRKAMRRSEISVTADADNVIEWLLQKKPMEIRNWKMPGEIWLEICVVSGRDPKEVIWQTEG